MNDSIFAIATSMQRSALHLHRISGNGIFEKLLPYLKSVRLDKVQHFPFTQYTILFDEHKNIIDDLIITFFRAPKSFTGEDLIEITSHGNPIISQRIQSFLRFLGFRDAREGEFTSRAFLHGKLDLAQAEAIRELIHAETFAAVQLSRNQLNGDLSAEIDLLREKFVDILSYLEAHIDFAPDEVGNYEPNFLIPKLRQIFERLQLLKNSYVNGIKMKEGLKIVLYGSPNVGKSTLYNKLLNCDRAIVTEIAGTTRDILTERLVIENRDFILMDTAGLRETKNTVEKLGVKRSLAALQEADIICHIIDGTKSLKHIALSSRGFSLSSRGFSLSSRGLTAGSIKGPLDPAVKPRDDSEKPRDDSEKPRDDNAKPLDDNAKPMDGNAKPTDDTHLLRKLFVISKKDLMNESKIKKIQNKFKEELSKNLIVFASKNDISDLQKKLVHQYDDLMSHTHLSSKLSPILISARTYDKVNSALIILEETFILLEKNDLPEKIASSLYYALKKLEEILGEVDIENIYQKIFSTFCIGK